MPWRKVLLTMTNSDRRHAEIAGAGFAGLTTAVALSQRGWSVRVHEKGPELRAFGAGIIMWENGLRVLKAIGAYDAVMSSSFTPPYYETRMHNVTVTKEAFDLPWRTMTRQHLFNSILEVAEHEGVDILADSEVVAADPAGSITLASGRTLSADLVVGADGVGSRVRDSAGFQLERHKSRDGITRLLVPRLKDELGEGEWDNVVDYWNLEPRVLRILYVPCNDEELYIAFMAPRADDEASRVPIDPDVWIPVFPHLRPVVEAAAKIHGRYDRYETTFVDTWTKGRIALVGDAAHAMTPALAQGAGCAMANGFGLAVALDDAETLDAGLAMWERQERPITDRCQRMSQETTETRKLAHGNYTSLLDIARHIPTGTDAFSVALV